MGLEHTQAKEAKEKLGSWGFAQFPIWDVEHAHRQARGNKMRRKSCSRVPDIWGSNTQAKRATEREGRVVPELLPLAAVPATGPSPHLQP